MSDQCECGICARCVMRDLVAEDVEFQQTVRAQRWVEAALARPSNVVPLHSYSIKVVS